MSAEQSARGTGGDVYGICCSLATLQARTQVDFEIDFFERILSRDPNFSEVLVCLGDLFASRGLHRRALRVDLKLAELHPDRADVHYNLACSQAVLGHQVDALWTLQRAVELGFSDADYMLADEDLSSLRQHPRFRQLATRIQSASRETVV